MSHPTPEEAVTGTATTGNVTLTSWTPVAGEYLFLGLACRQTGLSPTVAGNGQTWGEFGDSPVVNTQSQFELHLFGVVAASPTTGAITATLTGNTKPVCAIAVRVSGIDTGSPKDGSSACPGPAVDDDDMLCAYTVSASDVIAIAFGSHRAGVFTTPGDETTLSINLTAGTGGDLTSASMWYLEAGPGAVELGAANDLNSARDWAVYVLGLVGAAVAGGQPMMLRGAQVPGMRQWQPRGLRG